MREDAARKLAEGSVKIAIVSALGPVAGVAAEALNVAAAFVGLEAKRQVAGRSVTKLSTEARRLADELARDLLAARRAERVDPAVVARAAAALAPSLEQLDATLLLRHSDEPEALREALLSAGDPDRAFAADPDGRREHEALVEALLPRLRDLLSDRQLLESAASDAKAARKSSRRLEARAEAKDRGAEAALARDRGRVLAALRAQAARVTLLGLDVTASRVQRDLPLSTA